MNSAVGSTVTEQAGHANGIRIVVFQPLLAAERITNRRLQSVRQFNHFVAGIPAAIASEDRYRFRVVDHLHKLIQVGVGRAKDGWVRNRDLARAVGYIRRCDVARNRNYRRSFFEEGRENRSIDDRPRLLRIDKPPGVKRCGLEELVRIEFFERFRVDQARLHIASNGDDRCALLARVH